MGTIILIIVVILTVWFVSDSITKKGEIKNDAALTLGIIYKYPLIFEQFQLDGFTIWETKQSKVELYKILDDGMNKLRVHIIISYVAGNRLHYIIQVYQLALIVKHIKTGNFFYPFPEHEQKVIEKSNEDFFHFIGPIYSRFFNV